MTDISPAIAIPALFIAFGCGMCRALLPGAVRRMDRRHEAFRGWAKEGYMSIEFKEFDKIARLSRQCTITEKIDGTNAQVFIRSNNFEDFEAGMDVQYGDWRIRAGSRTKWISPADDNYGFARWVVEHQQELSLLGEGHHFGEWWGLGIQRKYAQTAKRFSLFNTSRWTPETVPACCSIVPVLYSGIFTSTAVDDALGILRSDGSKAAPGFMNPEGVIVYQSAARMYFKKTLSKDDEWKGKK